MALLFVSHVLRLTAVFIDGHSMRSLVPKRSEVVGSADGWCTERGSAYLEDSDISRLGWGGSVRHIGHL